MKATFQAAEPQPMAAPRKRQPRHYSRAGRLYAVSILLGFSWIGTVLFLTEGFLLWQHGTPWHGWLALAGLGLLSGGRAGAFILGRQVTCHLCHGTVLQEKSCHKHASATRLGPLSYRTTAAASILSRGTFRCMYCGTDYRLRK